MARLGGTENGGRCKLCNEETEDTIHALFTCPHNLVPGNALLGYLQVTSPGLTQEGALKLELEPSLDFDDILATLCVLSTGLKFIWECQISKKQVPLHSMRAEIEAKISILRKSRHSSAAVVMEGMLQ